MPYQFVEEKSLSDLLFTAEGKDLQELFTSCWEAAAEATIERIDAVEPHVHKKIVIEDEDLDFLLFDFLGEFIFYKDSEGLVLRVESIDITKNGNSWHLEADSYGETIDPEKHGNGLDIKAVTFHEFSLEHGTDGTWRARVLMDV